MKRIVSDVKSEKLAQELKDLETRDDDELKDRWHSLYGTKAPSEDSPFSADCGGCPPNAGESAGRTQILGPSPLNAGREQPGDSATITALPERTSQSWNRVGA
jgi:hypothetical protein